MNNVNFLNVIIKRIVNNVINSKKLNSIISELNLSRIEYFVYEILLELTESHITHDLNNLGVWIMIEKLRKGEYYERVVEDDFLVIMNSMKTQNFLPYQNEIKKYEKIILFIGAGVSFGSNIPLQKELENLKHLYNISSLEEIRNDEKKFKEFKKMFKNFSDKHEPTISHEIIARCFEKGVIRDIITTNWDNMLERCSDILRKRKINRDDYKHLEDLKNKDRTKGFFWKLHGDVEDIDGTEWVVEKEGNVFKCLEEYLREEYINKAMSEPFIFIIAGYSEKEENIKEKIIKPLESKAVFTLRIGSDYTRIGETGYLFGPADYILPKLFEDIC